MSQMLHLPIFSALSYFELFYFLFTVILSRNKIYHKHHNRFVRSCCRKSISVCTKCGSNCCSCPNCLAITAISSACNWHQPTHNIHIHMLHKNIAVW